MMLTPMVIAATTACNIPNRTAAVVIPATPATPKDVRAPVEALVSVTIGADGSVVAARVVHSSGIADVDAAALQAARDSKYAPKIYSCEPMQATYLLKSTFDPAAATPSASASPTPLTIVVGAPPCNVPVTIVHAATPAYPASAKDLGIGRVVVLVAVTVDADGKLIEAHIQQSSLNMALDQAALLAARKSTYAPMIVNCKKTTGVTIFRAVLDPAR
ncbi:MAG TPA: energy transducer TonB [Candidatus Aquilonibacter sp.]